jgi:hypothetical protein
MRPWRVGGALAVLLACAGASAEEPAFDASAFEKKPFEIGGYAELKQEHLDLNPSGTLYQLGSFARTGRRTLDRTTGTLQLAGTLRHGIAAFAFRTNSAVRKDATGHDTDNVLYEGFGSLQPSPQATVEAGKRALRWGKGYAWNPIAFVERAKDPNDPELAREGFWMLDGDFVFSPGGAVQTVAFTPVVVPVNDQVNGDFGGRGHVNPAAKLYLLVRDVDIDIAWAGQGSRPARFGFDFAANVKTNFEVHGEWARVGARATNWMLGLRYLTDGDTTWIAEYFHNGSGPDSRRDYLYARAQQKDALGIVYFQPALTAMMNVQDGSWQLTPELLYAGWRNVEIRARAYLLHGGNGTDFGEKQNRRKFEVYLRRYF